jgi:hypothetical protein
MFGLEKLLHDLRDMNYVVDGVVAGGQAFAIIKDYEVAAGRFMGQVIDLGIPAPENYPLAVGASIQVKASPQLFDYNDTVQGVRNIIQSPLGSDWRYWSLNFGQGNHTTRRLLSQINGVFDRA